MPSVTEFNQIKSIEVVNGKGRVSVFVCLRQREKERERENEKGSQCRH